MEGSISSRFMSDSKDDQVLPHSTLRSSALPIPRLDLAPPKMKFVPPAPSSALSALRRITVKAEPTLVHKPRGLSVSQPCAPSTIDDLVFLSQGHARSSEELFRERYTADRDILADGTNSAVVEVVQPEEEPEEPIRTATESKEAPSIVDEPVGESEKEDLKPLVVTTEEEIQQKPGDAVENEVEALKAPKEEIVQLQAPPQPVQGEVCVSAKPKEESASEHVVVSARHEEPAAPSLLDQNFPLTQFDRLSDLPPPVAASPSVPTPHSTSQSHVLSPDPPVSFTSQVSGNVPSSVIEDFCVKLACNEIRSFEGRFCGELSHSQISLFSTAVEASDAVVHVTHPPTAVVACQAALRRRPGPRPPLHPDVLALSLSSRPVTLCIGCSPIEHSLCLTPQQALHTLSAVVDSGYSSSISEIVLGDLSAVESRGSAYLAALFALIKVVSCPIVANGLSFSGFIQALLETKAKSVRVLDVTGQKPEFSALTAAFATVSTLFLQCPRPLSILLCGAAVHSGTTVSGDEMSEILCELVNGRSDRLVIDVGGDELSALADVVSGCVVDAVSLESVDNPTVILTLPTLAPRLRVLEGVHPEDVNALITILSKQDAVPHLSHVRFTSDVPLCAVLHLLSLAPSVEYSGAPTLAELSAKSTSEVLVLDGLELSEPEGRALTRFVSKRRPETVSLRRCTLDSGFTSTFRSSSHVDFSYSTVSWASLRHMAPEFTQTVCPLDIATGASDWRHAASSVAVEKLSWVESDLSSVTLPSRWFSMVPTAQGAAVCLGGDGASSRLTVLGDSVSHIPLKRPSYLLDAVCAVDIVTNEVYVLNSRSAALYSVTISHLECDNAVEAEWSDRGRIPVQRSHPAFCVNGDAWLFGGYKNGFSSELRSWSPDTEDWTLIRLSDEAGYWPAARSGARFVACGRMVVLIGGSGETGHLNSIWAFNVDTHRWSKIDRDIASLIGEQPWASAAVGEEVVVIGGRGAILTDGTNVRAIPSSPLEIGERTEACVVSGDSCPRLMVVGLGRVWTADIRVD